MITLKGITWQNPRGYDPLVAAAQSWTARHADVRIEWTQQPWYEFEALVLGNGHGEYDLVMFDHPWTGTLVNSQRLVPWDTLTFPGYVSELKRRVMSPSAESYEVGGNLWALPLDASCHAAVRREDLAPGDSLPATWQDVSAWAREHHRPPARYGMVLSVEGVLGHCLFLSMMAGLGYPAYHDPERPACDRAAAEHVLTTLRALLSFTPPGSTHWGPWDIYERLTTRNDIAYCPSIFAYVNYANKSGGGKLRLSQVPKFEGMAAGKPILGGVGLGITTTCQFVEQARDFGVFLMSDETQLHVFPAHNGQPATQNAWSDAELNAQTNGFYRALGSCMASAYVRPTYNGFHQLELEGGRALQRWWDGLATLHETLSALRATR